MGQTFISAAARHRGFPLMERPLMALALSSVAGLMNSWTIAHTRSFATVQSGNVVSAGYDLVNGDLPALVRALLSIAAFGAGSFLCATVVAGAARFGRTYSPWILGFETAVLAGVIAWSAWAAPEACLVAWLLSFVAGVQGNAFHRDSGMLYGNVAVTFVVQAVFSYLGRAAMVRWYDDGENHLRPTGVYVLVLVGFAAGGAVGCASDLLSNFGSVALAALATAAMFVIAAVSSRTDGPTRVDPNNNAPTP
ncbi:YoaK family protein [Mycobacterium saskatchewanense]|nr:YoaK family protein [Mycobacterium saskatchewanense]